MPPLHPAHAPAAIGLQPLHSLLIKLPCRSRPVAHPLACSAALAFPACLQLTADGWLAHMPQREGYTLGVRTVGPGRCRWGVGLHPVE